MKYPLEKATIWNVMRHPFDENTGDKDNCELMRLLSLIIFPLYVFAQVSVPVRYFLEAHYEEEAPMLMATLFAICLAVLVWGVYLVIAALTRFTTSVYFARLVQLNFWQILLLCTKKDSKKREMREKKLDEAWIRLEVMKAHENGETLALDDVISASCEAKDINAGIDSYMADLDGSFGGNEVARLFLVLYNNKLILSDNVAQFYRSLKGKYNEGEWVSENTVQRAVRKLNVREGAEAEQQKQVFNKYFSQIKTD